MGKAVIQQAGYILAHAPDLLVWHGSTADQARHANPNDEFLSSLSSHLRTFSQAAGDPANQCYIGNITPQQLEKQTKPWCQNLLPANAKGKCGEIVPEALLYGLMAYVDAFELVVFTEDFINKASQEAKAHHKLSKIDLFARTQRATEQEIKKFIDEHHASSLHYEGKLVGCVKAAHDIDVNLSAHIMLENLACKASAVIAGWQLPESELQQVDYVIECSEEAIGDVNQRGGGNLAKAIAESLGCQNATGIDMRGFCAGPVHALVAAAAHVSSGISKKVLVIAGGAVAKLGMNGRDHVKHDLPLLEDMLGGFAVLVSTDDGSSPVINTKVIGRHTVGTGSSPQAVMSSLISAPLKRANLTTNDVNKYSVEMQNPEITQPAGAGNVPEANYKMIAALSVKEGWLAKDQIMNFVAEHGMPGFAPTQGHIPSGVPYIGHGLVAIANNEIKNFMLVGKGSLFLGRMTNQFDGISVLVEKNTGLTEDAEGCCQNNSEQLTKLVAEAMRKVADELDNVKGG